MREQQLGLQAGRFHVFFHQELRAFLNALEDGHAATLRNYPVAQRKFKARSRLRSGRRVFMFDT